VAFCRHSPWECALCHESDAGLYLAKASSPGALQAEVIARRARQTGIICAAAACVQSSACCRTNPSADLKEKTQ
jgi:hypothetical protein